MAQSPENKTLSRIFASGRGWAFSQSDFANLGPRSSIDSSLYKLEGSNKIRRVLRGIYDYPRCSDFLKKSVSPDLDQVLHALARKFAWRIQPDGATAQNLLGLSTQVPAQIIYLSDGPNRSDKIGKTALVFQHTALKEAGFKLRESSLIVPAIKSFREEGIAPNVISKTRDFIDSGLREKILIDTKTATGWVYSVKKK